MNIAVARVSNRTTISGRVMLRRTLGKNLIFLTVEDTTSKIQVALHNSKIDVAKQDIAKLSTS